MRKKLCLFLTLLIFTISSYLHSEIIEIKHMKDGLAYFSSDALIIFDLDNTIMMPAQELGSDQWFYYQVQHYLNKGLAEKEAIDKTLVEWMAIQALTEMKLVEPETKGIIDQLQKEKKKVIGLTTRHFEMSMVTDNKLTELQIDLSKTSIANQDMFFQNISHGVLYTKGVLYTSGTNKGEAFLKFIDSLGHRPKKIIFVNDKDTHLRELEGPCLARGINFVGLRYSFLDEKVKNFKWNVAKVQMQHFARILSDKEAEKLKN